MPGLKISILQQPLVWMDGPANLRHFDRQLEGISGRDVIVLPEMFTTGFAMEAAKQSMPQDEVIACINRLTREAASTGLKTGIIATDETKDQYADGLVLSIGSREEEETIAHHLYGVLRDFDEAQVNVIYSEAFYTPRMGQAIMNRLLKAAGHKIIKTQEEEK